MTATGARCLDCHSAYGSDPRRAVMAQFLSISDSAVMTTNVGSASICASPHSMVSVLRGPQASLHLVRAPTDRMP